MKTVRLGMIGCGSMSRFHGKVYTTQVKNAEIVALCDTHPGNLDQYQREIFDPIRQRPPQFADYRDMLAKVKMDAVFIVTPHAHHYQQVMDSLDAGCQVFVEKPMVLGSAEARGIIKQAEKRNRILSVAFPGTFSAEFQYIRGLMDKGELGDAITASAFVTQAWKRITKDTWRQDPKLAGGGEAFDSGAHAFNALLYLVNSRPAEVFAWTNNRGAPVDITCTASIRYENGALGTATINGDSVLGWEQGIRVSFTKGEIETGIHGGRLQQWGADGRPVKYPPVPAVRSLQQWFIDCVLGKVEDPAPAVWGLRQSLFYEALYESARTGKAVKVEKE
ncbi:MAG TPA: Gfo/Idh/MocA family oxidoreductase [Verrucomicrobiae bacterium]|nr:Gfo/Idh/MocA family oxidoreductase [Verrucomicrobiae bacterium]